MRFSEVTLRDFLDSRSQSLVAEIESEQENSLLNVDPTQYLDYLVTKYSVEPVVLHWDQMTVSPTTRMVPAEMHDFRWNVVPGKSYERQAIIYRIPLSGNVEVLRYQPSTFNMSGRPGFAVDGTKAVTFEILRFDQGAEELKQAAESRKSEIQRDLAASTTDVDRHNQGLRSLAEDRFAKRKATLLERLELLHSLGVPVQKSDSVPATFAVDSPKKRLLVKPSAPDKAFAPEPIMQEQSFRDILQTIHDMGVEMERHPSIYRGKNEETLRDYFLMVLAPNFHSVAGETFNKIGKTDILVRHDKANLFVAECAIWKGQAAYLQKIDQALSYLTWRDSKAAIILFVKSKKFEPVLETVRSATAQHPCWTKTDTPRSDSWFPFRFHLPDDDTRGVDLAVLAFHVPHTDGT